MTQGAGGENSLVAQGVAHEKKWGQERLQRVQRPPSGLGFAGHRRAGEARLDRELELEHSGLGLVVSSFSYGNTT